MSSRRDAVLRGTYRLGWRVAGRIPAPVVSVIIRGLSRIGRRHDGDHVQTLRRNLGVVSGGAVPDRLLDAALASYLRNFYEVLALPTWTQDQVIAKVTTVGEQTLRDAYAGRGAVVALPHSANWDLAGAWACGTGMPVTTVAEQLPEAEFAAFLAFRQGLGMEILSHRDPATLGALAAAVRAGRLVCLVADRDLEGSGLPVTWAGRTITMPAGPAMVARRTGAALIPAVCRFTATGMTIIFGDVVAERPGREGLRAMTQDVADFFAATIAEQPEDWHMLQPFFGGDAP